MHSQKTSERIENLRRRPVVYSAFMLVLSVYVLVALILDTFVINDPETKKLIQYVDLGVCGVFLFDFFYLFLTAKSKLEYMRWGWLDLLSSIPLVDPLRWTRVSRVIRIVRFLRTLKSLSVLVSAIANSRFYSLTLVVMLVTFITYTLCAALILEFERNAGGSIDTAKEALWWAFLNIMNAKVSITQAASEAGVVITIILNKLGLLLFAYFNAILIAWLLKQRRGVKAV